MASLWYKLIVCLTFVQVYLIMSPQGHMHLHEALWGAVCLKTVNVEAWDRCLSWNSGGFTIIVL